MKKSGKEALTTASRLYLSNLHISFDDAGICIGNIGRVVLFLHRYVR